MRVGECTRLRAHHRVDFDSNSFFTISVFLFFLPLLSRSSHTPSLLILVSNMPKGREIRVTSDFEEGISLELPLFVNESNVVEDPAHPLSSIEVSSSSREESAAESSTEESSKEISTEESSAESPLSSESHVQNSKVKPNIHDDSGLAKDLPEPTWIRKGIERYDGYVISRESLQVVRKAGAWTISLWFRTMEGSIQRTCTSNV